MFIVYILYSQKLKRFYIGTTDNLALRLEQHNTGHYVGSYSVKGIPWELVLTIYCENSKQAYTIENHIKRMKSKAYIQNLLKYPEMIDKLKKKY